MSYVKQMTLALRHVHHQGAVHQDIKSENVLVGQKVCKRERRCGNRYGHPPWGLFLPFLRSSPKPCQRLPQGAAGSNGCEHASRGGELPADVRPSWRLKRMCWSNCKMPWS